MTQDLGHRQPGRSDIYRLHLQNRQVSYIEGHEPRKIAFINNFLSLNKLMTGFPVHVICFSLFIFISYKCQVQTKQGTLNLKLKACDNNISLA